MTENVATTLAPPTMTTDANGCIRKVLMVNETEYGEEYVCEHKMEQRCSETMHTTWVPQKVTKLQYE